MPKPIKITTLDNTTIQANFFNASDFSNKVVLIVSGVGIQSKFYASFAECLSSNGYPTYTFDYRGIGLSKFEHIKKTQATVSDWGEYDIESMIQYTQQQHPDKELCIIAHSGGGTILGLAKSVSTVNKIMLVASPQALLKNYAGMGRFKMWMIVFVLYPFLSKILGYFPSKFFKLGEDLPKGVALEWAKWGRNPKGMEACIGDKIQSFHSIHSPILSLSFDDDFFASAKCVDYMHKVYKNASIKRQHFKSNDVGNLPVGHFIFFKRKYLQYFEPLTLNFLKD